jgi:Tfp pilus assembly protein PilF
MPRPYHNSSHLESELELEGNNLIEAKPALEKAVELAPRNVDARWNLGGVYFNSGNRSKAAAQLKEIIRIAPTSAMGQQAKQMLVQLGG